MRKKASERLPYNQIALLFTQVNKGDFLLVPMLKNQLQSQNQTYLDAKNTDNIDTFNVRTLNTIDLLHELTESAAVTLHRHHICK